MGESQGCQKRFVTAKYLYPGGLEWDPRIWGDIGWVDVYKYQVIESSAGIHLSYCDPEYSKDVKQGVIVSSLELSVLQEEGVEIKTIERDGELACWAVIE